MQKRLLAELLCIMMVMLLLPTAARAADSELTELDISEGNIKISNSGASVGADSKGLNSVGYKIINSQNTATQNTIKVESGVHNITISDLNIDVSRGDSACAFAISSGATLNLTLAGTNTLKSGMYSAGLQVPAGATLTIAAQNDDSDSLTATGGESGAGIGGGGADTFDTKAEGIACGMVTISGGTVTATSDGGGAGIGGGGARSNSGTANGGDGGTVTISGGTVTATSDGGGAGIGGGGARSNASAYGGAGGMVTISGGTVTVTSDGGGAGIGGGTSSSFSGTASGGDGGTVTISSGTVAATGEGGGAGIGGGIASNNTGTANGGAGGTLAISGGTVTAKGIGGVGIGSVGIGGGSARSNANAYGGEGSTVTISGGTVIATATGYTGSVGIGGGTGHSEDGAGGTLTSGGESPVNVYLTTISLPDAAADIPIASLNTADMSYAYGMNGVKTMNGKLYLYLPKGATVNSLTAGDSPARFFSNQSGDIITVRNNNNNTGTLKVATAAINDVMVCGITGTEISTLESVATITLTGDEFYSLAMNTSVSAWFTNRPAGLEAKLSTPIAANTKTATVTFYGTPTYVKEAAMEVTIPAENLMSGVALAMTINANAKWSISPPTVTSVAVSPATVSVAKGGAQQFLAAVTGVGNPDGTVTWTVEGGVAGSTIDSSGKLTLSADETAATLIVKATSTLNTTKVGAATVTVTTPPALPAADDDNTPQVVTVDNDPSIPNPTVWLTGPELGSGDSLVYERDPQGTAYKALLKLADSGDVIGTYNIYLRSGKKSTGSAMNLSFGLNAQYAGQAFTLVHQKSNGAYEYFYDTADANGDLSFGPLYELSPFMLVKGRLEQTAYANLTDAPKTGDRVQPALWIAVALMAAAALASLVLRKQKID